jgi:hypothetical protein
MEIATAFSDLNWLAILAATISAFIIGGAWYSPLLFQKAWISASKIDQEDIKKRSPFLIFGFSFLLSFIMSLNLALFIGQGDIVFGIIAGFLTGFGWVAMGIGIISLFENRSLKYFLINGGYMIITLTAMGLILGAWK